MVRGGLLMTHRWLALLAFLPLFVVLLSGAALSFVHEFDRAMHPQLLSVSASKPIDISSVSAIIEADVASADLIAIRYPSSPYDPVRLHLKSDAKQWLRYLNPHSGKVLGERQLEQDWTVKLIQLHTRVLNVKFGSILTLIGTIALLLMLLLGISLLRRVTGWRVKGWHAWIGLCTAPVLLLIVLSGLFSISGVAKMSSSDELKHEEPDSLGALLRLSRSETISLCAGRPLELQAVSNNSAELRCDDGTSWSLTSVGDELTTKQKTGNEKLLWNIHSGEWAGLPGRAFWMWSVLGVFYLLYSGLRDWLMTLRRDKA